MARRARGPKELVTVAEYDVTPGLHEWIEGEIQRQEQAALSHGDGPLWEYDETLLTVRDAQGGGAVAHVILDGTGDHIMLNDPDAALRRCTADRKILAAHPYSTVAGGRAGFGCDTCHQSEYGGTEDDGNCATILALAEAYGLEPAEETDVEVVKAP
ncbi:DUF6221 family protein [Streptomyces sp. NBC_01383]|uniref:DUF6221 family protein n=1 Tax=Streptomyces sp. NBC_01383 TaxID=2903846 RepID=UPI003254FC8E